MGSGENINYMPLNTWGGLVDTTQVRVLSRPAGAAETNPLLRWTECNPIISNRQQQQKISC
uniref:Uncharacterized protein n=1 Tax=Anguilla anguilla TaxID=7936 RepID=A0A0E9VAW0_ANGAN